MKERLDKHGARLYTLEQLDIPQQVSIAVSEVVTDAVDWAMQAPLRNRFRDLPEADMKEILYQRMWETESYKSHEGHMQLFEALEKSMNCDHSEELASPSHQSPPPPPPAGPSGASRAPGASRSSQVPPPPPPPPPPSSTNQESLSKGSAAPSSSKTVTSAEYQAWTMTDVRLRSSISLTPADLEMDKDMGPDEQAQLSDDEDIGSAHIPKVNLRQDWWKPLEEERTPTPEPAWSIPSSDAPMKAAYYPDAGLEQMVPDQFWIDEECKYDIAAMYGISLTGGFKDNDSTLIDIAAQLGHTYGSSVLYESKFFLCIGIPTVTAAGQRDSIHNSMLTLQTHYQGQDDS
nr:hypothetical protein [Tanacetum cinerariifolium]